MVKTADQVFSDSPYIRRISRLSHAKLSCIDNYLQILLKENSELLKKTHYFHDRFENIYLNRCEHPDLNELMAESLKFCAGILEADSVKLKIGYWFNLMQPGDVTTLHRHDDLDELISGVIYLAVPQHSGNLILKVEEQEIIVTPELGNYIFFDPATPHAVSKNQSASHRLSIGMNIGLLEH